MQSEKALSPVIFCLPPVKRLPPSVIETSCVMFDTTSCGQQLIMSNDICE